MITPYLGFDEITYRNGYICDDDEKAFYTVASRLSFCERQYK